VAVENPEPTAATFGAPRSKSFEWAISHLPPLMVLSAAMTAAVWMTAGQGLPIDDAYIHLTFAKNLGQGHGFSFNPGEHSLGFTSPLWIFILAAIGLTKADPVTTARAASAICFALSALALHQLVKASLSPSDENAGAGPRPQALAYALVAGLGMAGCGNMLWLAGSGMEATLFLLAGLLAIIILRGPSQRPLIGGALLGLLVLTRPTGLILAIILVGLGLAEANRRKHALKAAAVAIAVCAPWLIYSLITTGRLLTPTRAGKLASNLFNAGLSIKGAAKYAMEHVKYIYMADRGVFYLALFAAAAAAIIVGGRLIARPGGEEKEEGPRPRLAVAAFNSIIGISPAGVLVVWAMAHFLAHSIMFRSTAALTPYHYLRYQVMLIPAVAVGAALALYAAAEALARGLTIGNDPGKKALVRAVFHGFALFLLASPLIGEARQLEQWRGLYRTNVEHLQRVHRAAADWARSNTAAEARIASLDIGMLGYYSQRYVVDLGGLTDPAAHQHLEKRRCGPYIIEKGATHLFHLVAHDSNRITGAMDDNGKLYRLKPLRLIKYPPYAQPAPGKLPPHSLGIEIHQIEPMPNPKKQ